MNQPLLEGAASPEVITINRARAFRRGRYGVGMTDFLCLIWSVAGAQVLRFGADNLSAEARGVPYILLGGAIAVCWWVVLGLCGSRDVRVMSDALEEFRRISVSAIWTFGLIAIGSYLLRLDIARAYVAISLPLGLIALLFARTIMRARLAGQRRLGLELRRVMLLGSPDSVNHLCTQLTEAPEAGYLPTSVYISTSHFEEKDLALPDSVAIFKGTNSTSAVIDAIVAAEVDMVIFSNGAPIAPRVLRELGWQLSARDISMVVAPALTDVAGPRIHTQPVAGLPLIHVTTPKLDGFRGALKRGFDLVGSSLIILLLSPVLLGVALAVRLSSPGPVLYSQVRIGQGGEPFKMYKFRSMVTNADSMLGDLLRAQGSDGKPLFKVENDPRITKVGGVLRRYSLDELPQLFNVLLGSMSLVGPRPQREAEVALYDDYAHRRLIVKPGMSGLWQVSGRSNLTWEQAIRFDLYYVDNWSLLGDLIILAKTFKAVVAKDGAV